jgi:hypothetical protein
MYEDADQCPACGEYVTVSDAGVSGWPWWFVALGFIGILSVLLTMSCGL